MKSANHLRDIVEARSGKAINKVQSNLESLTKHEERGIVLYPVLEAVVHVT